MCSDFRFDADKNTFVEYAFGDFLTTCECTDYNHGNRHFDRIDPFFYYVVPCYVLFFIWQEEQL